MSGISDSKLPYIYVEPTGGDDTSVLQLAFDSVVSGELVLRGKFNISGNVYLRNKSGLLLNCYGAVIEGGDFDFQGSQRIRIQGLGLIGNLVYGRGENGQGGDIRLQDVEIVGDANIAQADNATLDNVYVHGKLNLSTHHDGVWAESTFKGANLSECWFDGGIVMTGLIQNIKLDSCFFSNSVVCVNVQDHVDAGTSNQCWNISFYNCNAESSDLFLKVANTHGLHNVTINNLNWACLSSHIIEIDTPDQLSNAYIQNISRSNPSGTETFNVVRGTLENVWYDGIKV